MWQVGATSPPATFPEDRAKGLHRGPSSLCDVMNRFALRLPLALLLAGTILSYGCKADDETPPGGEAGAGEGGTDTGGAGSGGTDEGGAGSGGVEPSRCEALCDRVYDTCESSLGGLDESACLSECGAFDDETVDCLESAACSELGTCLPELVVPTSCEEFCDGAVACDWLEDGEDDRAYCMYMCEREWKQPFECLAEATARCSVRGFDTCLLDPEEPAHCTELCDGIHYGCDGTTFEKKSRPDCGRKCMEATGEQLECVQAAADTCDQRAIDTCMLSPAEASRCTAMCDHLYYDCGMTFSGFSRAGCGTACTENTAYFDPQTVACFTEMECNFEAAEVCLLGG